MALPKNTAALAIAVPSSSNSKLGDKRDPKKRIAATYTSQRSCPITCPLLDMGCYARTGHMRNITMRLNNASSTATPIEVALAEASAIREMITESGKHKVGTHKNVQGRPMRMHGVGDAPTPQAATILAEVAKEYPGPVYTYSHGHEVVPRSAWGDISVLASCETIEQAADAMNRGYAAAVVVEEHAGPKPYRVGDITVQPCPNQTTKGVTCVTCRLCMNDKKLLSQKRVIAFEAHGSGQEKVREVLRDLVGVSASDTSPDVSDIAA